MEFDLENPLMTCVEFLHVDGVKALFDNELDHTPAAFFSVDDIRVLIRREILCFICNAQYNYHLDPKLSYLAVNYVDRFISRTEVVQQKKKWMIVILAVSSLSLAAKMMNIDISPLLYNLVKEENMNLNIQIGIQRMEKLILNTLNWRMRSITPFSFLNFFISLFEYEEEDEDANLPHALKCCASQIIFNSNHEMKLLEYRPSVIGASAFLLATQILMPANFLSFSIAVSACENVHKETLKKCLKITQDALKEGCTEALTPTSVLDKPNQSYKNKNRSMSSRRDDQNKNRSTSSRRDDLKRQKMNGFYTYDADQIV